MIKFNKEINRSKEIVAKRYINEQLVYHDLDSTNSKRDVQIRNEIFSEIINLINYKRYYMLGPEKGISAKFIAENYKDIFQILLKKIQDDNMRKNISPIIKTTLLCIIITAFIRCDEMFETDISNEEVILLSPVDSTETDKFNQVFWWNQVPEADYYNLLVVRNSFDQIEELILDSVITGNQFKVILDTGKFQWQVIAFNYHYETSSAVFNLFIDFFAERIKYVS